MSGQGSAVGLGPLAGMAANMQAEAEEAKAEAAKAAEWREKMLAGQLVMVALLERSTLAAEAAAAAVVSLEARATAFGTKGAVGAFLGQHRRPPE